MFPFEIIIICAAFVVLVEARQLHYKKSKTDAAILYTLFAIAGIMIAIWFALI